MTRKSRDLRASLTKEGGVTAEAVQSDVTTETRRIEASLIVLEELPKDSGVSFRVIEFFLSFFSITRTKSCDHLQRDYMSSEFNIFLMITLSVFDHDVDYYGV